MAAGMGVLGTMMHIGIHSPSAQYFAIAMLLMFIVGFAMVRSADLGTVLRNSAAERPRFWRRLLHRHQLDCQHDRWRNVLTMLNTLGNANTFWVYAALNVLFILLTLWLVPETKHVRWNILNVI